MKPGANTCVLKLVLGYFLDLPLEKMSGQALPPRLRKTNSLRRDQTKSSLEILMQMGFTKQRSEKAIAATGDRGVQLASDWLLSHVNDKHLDEGTCREYILYLCPTGAFNTQLMEFWEKSQALGWNGAHSYFPHITLCPFFTVENSKAHIVKKALSKLEISLRRAPGRLTLDFFSQSNFIGLFIQEPYYKYLKEVVSIFAAELQKSGVTVESQKKQLHTTLAYQYQSEHHDQLNKLAKNIDLNAECSWDIRVYSRDPRTSNCEVRKVVKAYKANLEDELDLIMGDYVTMDTQEVARSQDGWYNGSSWVSGMQGMFPGPYTQRTAETWTWTLHGSIPMLEGCMGNGVVEGATGGEEENYDNLWNDPSALYAKVNKPKKEKSPEEKKRLPRQLIVTRHGERMDFIFGRDWCDKCFDDSGNYSPTDLNMPRKVPKRASNYLDYVKDAPLTAIGQMQAFLTGEALKEAGIEISHIYSSPSLRCIQTATYILKGLNTSCVIRIEPCIFEWLGWYQLGLPRWFSPEELKSHGYNIDTSYTPFLPATKFDMDETIEGYYKRSGSGSKHILKLHEQDGGNILIVGHAGSVEVCTRQVLGKAFRSGTDFRDIVTKVPYCGLVKLQEDPSNKKWSVCESPILPLTHGQNKGANTKKLLYPS